MFGRIWCSRGEGRYMRLRTLARERVGKGNVWSNAGTLGNWLVAKCPLHGQGKLVDVDEEQDVGELIESACSKIRKYVQQKRDDMVGMVLNLTTTIEMVVERKGVDLMEDDLCCGVRLLPASASHDHSHAVRPGPQRSCQKPGVHLSRGGGSTVFLLLPPGQHDQLSRLLRLLHASQGESCPSCPLRTLTPHRQRDLEKQPWVELAEEQAPSRIRHNELSDKVFLPPPPCPSPPTSFLLTSPTLSFPVLLPSSVLSSLLPFPPPLPPSLPPFTLSVLTCGQDEIYFHKSLLPKLQHISREQGENGEVEAKRS
eukprot:259107-Hanusia_phi.AAC.1